MGAQPDAVDDVVDGTMDEAELRRVADGLETKFFMSIRKDPMVRGTDDRIVQIVPPEGRYPDIKVGLEGYMRHAISKLDRNVSVPLMPGVFFKHREIRDVHAAQFRARGIDPAKVKLMAGYLEQLDSVNIGADSYYRYRFTMGKCSALTEWQPAPSGGYDVRFGGGPDVSTNMPKTVEGRQMFLRMLATIMVFKENLSSDEVACIRAQPGRDIFEYSSFTHVHFDEAASVFTGEYVPGEREDRAKAEALRSSIAREHDARLAGQPAGSRASAEDLTKVLLPETHGSRTDPLRHADSLCDIGFFPKESMTAYEGIMVAAVAQEAVDPDLFGGPSAVRALFELWVERYGISEVALLNSFDPSKAIRLAGLAASRAWLEARAGLMEQSPAAYARTHFERASRLLNRPEPDAHTGRTKILPRIPGRYHWDHFRPIVEFCLNNGCRFSGGRYTEKIHFRTDQGGQSRCVMVGPVTMQDVLAKFGLPESFKVVWADAPYIEDFNNHTMFFLCSEEEHVLATRRAQAILERERAQMKARRERWD